MKNGRVDSMIVSTRVFWTGGDVEMAAAALMFHLGWFHLRSVAFARAFTLVLPVNLQMALQDGQLARGTSSTTSS